MLISVLKATLSSGDLHLLSEYLNSFFIGYILNYGSPFLPRINTIIEAAVESGLVHHWITISTGSFDDRPVTRERHVKVLSIMDLKLAFIIIIGGYFISICSFVLELTIRKRQISLKKRLVVPQGDPEYLLINYYIEWL